MCSSLEKQVQLPKNTLRKIFADITLSFSGEMTKYELVKNVHNVMITNEEETFDQMFELIELEEEDEGSI